MFLAVMFRLYDSDENGLLDQAVSAPNTLLDPRKAGEERNRWRDSPKILCKSPIFIRIAMSLYGLQK